MNVMPKTAPPGFDAWMGNGGGNYIAPAFMTENLDFLDPPIKDGQHKFPEENYTTAVVGNVSSAWIRKVVKEDPTRPFFAYIAPKGSAPSLLLPARFLPRLNTPPPAKRSSSR
jgi:hypothetical protein